MDGFWEKRRNGYKSGRNSRNFCGSRAVFGLAGADAFGCADAHLVPGSAMVGEKRRVRGSEREAGEVPGRDSLGGGVVEGMRTSE